MIVDETQYLAHYGILRKSGRYPWGSGGTQSARNRSFLDTVDELKRKGMSEPDIAKSFEMTTTQLRALKSIAKNQQRQEQINQVQRLKDRGWSNVAIGERMGINESSVRALQADGQKDKADVLKVTSEMLKKQVDQKDFVDIGTGVELGLGLSKDKFQTAVAVLREQGYQVHTVQIEQLGTGKQTTIKVLAKPGTTQKDVWLNRDKIQPITDHTNDGGHTYEGLRPPTNIASKRVAVVYGPEGGTNKDGLIELRPGVKDLDMGGSPYAQVRIAVDGTHYLKGMAIYNPDLPAGTDVRFNTNKSNTGNKLDAMKEMERRPDGSINLEQPFSASIKTGGQRGALNIVNEAGDWDKHSRSLPSQMLSKQSPALARQQLDVTYERRRNELEAVTKLTNPAVKKKLLETFGDETDAAAVHLKAAAMPRQASKVILPIPEVKAHEIYAPTFKNGERVSLVRFPHGGIFEIPELTVNNRNSVAKRLLGNAPDAVGINHKTAEQLSGADFDGDSVLVIPNSRGSIKSKPPLDGLKGFDPRAAYPAYDGMRTVDGGTFHAATKSVTYKDGGPNNQMQKQMGQITNLIADMTIKGANEQELARAVRHSMVVIDSEKHRLDYRASARDNGIPALKHKYQGRSDAGASTLITKAGSAKFIEKRKPRSAKDGGPIDRATGEKVFVPTGQTTRNKKGESVPRMERVDLLSVTKNAHDLSSGTVIERIYADHSNKLKALANEARKEQLGVQARRYEPSAKKVYSAEVESLNSQLTRALKNAPLERHAQVLAHVILAQKRQANPGMDKDEQKKARNQALAEARTRTGAKKARVQISPREWEAIQAGAISNHKLEQILANSDLDKVRELATPRVVKLMTSTKTSRAKSMLASGYTQAEVAEALGVSLTTLKSSINE